MIRNPSELVSKSYHIIPLSSNNLRCDRRDTCTQQEAYDGKWNPNGK
jgi:hypothetical protein